MFQPFRVTVPCSTSNLGPGFDCLGLALERYLEVEVRPARGAASRNFSARLHVSGTLAERPLDGEERIGRAIQRFARERGAELPCVELNAKSTIPVARGLGSSGSATVAGLLIANELLGAKAGAEYLFNIGCALEGHPDNIGPALVGGCTIAMPGEDDEVVWYPTPIHSDLRATVVFPKTRVETQRARKVLPEFVNFSVARDQARRLGQLLHGLATAERKYLQIGIADELHTPFRAPLIPGCERVMEAARRAGAHAAAISGSGSAMIALGNCKECDMQQIGEAMAAAFRDAGESPEIFISKIPTAGARIEKIQ